MSDPTLHLLQALDDPERYVCTRGVPVFVPHVRYGDDENDDGTPKIEAQVDEHELNLIAEVLNRKVAEFGTPARISTGHVRLPKPDQPAPPESSQPEILGWAKNARYGTWGPENKPGLLVDWYIRKDRWEESLTYPYRSAEYYPPTHEITGIALLRRDPELDMGVLTYARRGTPETAMPEEFDDDYEDDLDNSDLEGDDGPGDDEPDGDEYSPEEHEQYARAMRWMHQHAQSRLDGMDPEDEDYPHMEQMARCYGRLAYEGGAPAGGNTYVPGTGDEDLDEPPLPPVGGELEDEPEQHARGGKRTQQYNRQRQPERQPRRKPRGEQSQYGRKVYELEQQVAALQERDKRRGEMIQYERELVRLQTQEGVELDLEQELADAEEMTPKGRQRHLERIQKQYARSITGGSFLPTSGPSETQGVKKGMTARQRAAAIKYAETNKVSWPQAMAWAMQNS